MGAYSPAPALTDKMCEQVMAEIMIPTAKAMKAEGHPFKGALYAGLMITEKGPQLIEFNVRFGDPECQVILFRLKSDLLTALMATINGTLGKIELDWEDRVALSVVMATKGYPGSYKKGTEIKKLEEAGSNQDVFIFHAGTVANDGKTLATGGRVLNVTSLGNTVSEARNKAYRAIKNIDWKEGFYRTDIGWRAIDREKG